MKRVLPLLLTVIISVLLFSCSTKPSFTNENIAQSLKDMLQKEFDINAMIKINNQTLGLCFYVPKLFSGTQKTSPVVTDHLQNVMLCLRRVLLSTNANINFFQINIRGNDTSLEISMLRYIRDLKILLLSGISFGDYSKRMIYKNVSNIPSHGIKRLEMLFNDYGQKKPEDIINFYFDKNLSDRNISKEFLTWLWESMMKTNISNNIVEFKVRAINEKRYLFYCKVNEIFEPKHLFKNTSFISKNGENTEFLFEIESANFYYIKINKAFIIDSKNQFQNTYLQSVYKLYKNPLEWDNDDFYVFDISLSEFIAEQIAARIQGFISEEASKKDDKNPLDMTIVKGFSEDGYLKIYFIYKDNKAKIDINDKETAVKIAKEVCELYKFKEWKEMMVGTLTETMSVHSLFD